MNRWLQIIVALCAILVVELPLSSWEISIERRLENGAKAFKYCANCHTLEAEDGTRIGPTLYGIVGRPVASIQGFQYSAALIDKGGIWTERELDVFLTRPKHALAGTNMRFGGVLSPHARLDLIEYLKQRPDLSRTENDDIISLLQVGDGARGAGLAEPCLVCHNVNRREGHSIGPNLHGIFGREISSAPGFNYSDDLRNRTGYWNIISLNAFMFETKSFQQGSHAAFLKPGAAITDRADLIAWLKTLK